MVKKLFNGRSNYVWRFLILIILSMFGFYGARLYAQIDRNQTAIYSLATSMVNKSDIAPLQADIRDLRAEIRELNCYLRDSKKVK